MQVEGFSRVSAGIVGQVQWISVLLVQPNFHDDENESSPALKYEYVGRAWYFFSCKHDVIGKGQEISEQKGNVVRAVHPRVIELSVGSLT